MNGVNFNYMNAASDEGSLEERERDRGSEREIKRGPARLWWQEKG